MPKSEFYLRYYVGHKGKFGHEFLEFEFRPDGKFIDNIRKGFGSYQICFFPYFIFNRCRQA